MSENKKKYAYWMKPSMVEEITEMLDTANATSKSDFVCQAVQFYIGYLHQKKCIDVGVITQRAFFIIADEELAQPVSSEPAIG